MMMNPNHIRAIAELVSTLRPSWGAQGVRAALMKLVDKDPFDVAHASVAAARDELNRTPAVIALDGTHWQQSDSKPPVRPLAERAAEQRAQQEARRQAAADARASRERARRECSGCDDAGRLPSGMHCGHPKAVRSC